MRMSCIWHLNKHCRQFAWILHEIQTSFIRHNLHKLRMKFTKINGMWTSHFIWNLLEWAPGFIIALCLSSSGYIWGGVTLQSTGYLLSIMFIFDRFHRSSAAVTQVKYANDSNNLTGIFCKTEEFLNGETYEQNFANLHPYWSSKNQQPGTARAPGTCKHSGAITFSC